MPAIGAVPVEPASPHARVVRGFAVLAMAVLLAGCATIIRQPPPPPAEVERIAVLDQPDARFWADGDPAPLRRYLEQMLERQEVAAQGRGPAPPAASHFLALSGGADDGAFGAGVLAGWTESGTRPSFTVVTGISAGALIAPFAFLGPGYDGPLRELFTETAPGDVLLLGRIATALLFRQALADTSPLARLIARHADERMLGAIAAEYARGRVLLIGTVNLDVGRPVVWNIGAIAASGHPRALELFRSILLASASIPGAFPPVLIDVEHEGRRFEEMHVDGGAAVQVFLYPPGLTPRDIWARSGRPRERTAWVIRNGRLDVVPLEAPRGLFSIAARSARTLLHFSGVNDINAIYLTTQRDGVAFRLQSIGPDFQAPRAEPFDTAYMRALFEYGRQRGRDPGNWRRSPPPIGLLIPTAD